MKLGFRVPETSRTTTVGEKETLPTFLPGLTTERTVFLELLASVSHRASGPPLLLLSPI